MATSTTSPLLAGAFGDCCFSASLKHEGDPVGRIETIAGFQTYVSDPPASTTGSGPKKVILYLSDVYGPFLNSIELLQDFYASNGMRLSSVIVLLLTFFWKVFMFWALTIFLANMSASMRTSLGLIDYNGRRTSWTMRWALLKNG